MNLIPRISVILPVYNGEKYLEEAVQSILNQTEKDFELLIVDDGSTDTTAQIVKTFSDVRIKYHLRPHQGLVECLNFAIGVAIGEYVARMDADDVSLPERLSIQANFLDTNHDMAMCGTWATLIDEKGESKGAAEYPPVDSKKVRFYALLHNPFIHPSVMVRKEIFKTIGGYKKWFRHIEDYELWTRVLVSNKGANIPQRLLMYRVHDKQITASKNIEMRLRGIIVRLSAFVRFIF